MIECCNMKFSDLKNKIVIDRDAWQIGRVSDFVVTYTSNDIKVKSVIIAGSRREELLEFLGLKPDDDPVFQIDCISQIGDVVQLSVPKEDLKSTLDNGILGQNDMKMSELTRIKVVDSDGFKVGNVIDFWFDAENRIWLVLGGGFLEELLEQLRFQPDIDLLVSLDDIKNISKEEICLKYTKFQLQSTCEKEYERYMRIVASQHEPGDAITERLRLFPGPSKGPI